MNDMKKICKNRDFVIGIGMLLVSLLFLQQTKFIMKEVYLMPYIVLVIMILSSFFVIIKSMFTENKEEEEEQDASAVTIRDMIFPFLLLCAAFVLMDKLGFYATIFIVIFLLKIYIEKRNTGKNNYLIAVIFSVILTVLLFVVFAHVLNLQVPRDVVLF